ncbi:cytochrome P450 [Amphibacillus sp. MSJ-3]|uniref:cytochrome P450 n=1 Tax=Amphibacillus sp. MSJ-3 TaxID=2841505 RepID=UPI00209E6140|nr:cytochrome P450 [Amphibacillus sp. MSJ-3]
MALLKEGYLYMANRFERFDSNIFATRLLGGQKVICMTGKEAAKVFYDNARMIRSGAAPKRFRQTLLGEKGIQTIDGFNHENRKRMFISLMTEKRIQDIVRIYRREWESAIFRWENQKEVLLYDDVTVILTKTACEWAGIPIAEDEIVERAGQLSSLFQSGAKIGPKHWQGRINRNLLENWIQKLVEDVRDKKLEPKEETALYQISWFQDGNGKLLNTEVAAVEVLNVIRPIVAIAIYIVFIALSLYNYPAEKNKLLTGDRTLYEMFVQEVRRYYPFFPFVAARVRKDFLLEYYPFKAGTLVLLDLYGTNHHPDLWDKPDQFLPQRFKARRENPFDFIPQGGGDYIKGHRCPGEQLTVEMMKASLDLLVNKMDYQVPAQNLTLDMAKIPSFPNSKFLITRIKSRIHE